MFLLLAQPGPGLTPVVHKETVNMVSFVRSVSLLLFTFWIFSHRKHLSPKKQKYWFMSFNNMYIYIFLGAFCLIICNWM